MFKKIANLALAAVMLLCFFGLAGCGTDGWERLQSSKCCETSESSSNFFSNFAHSTAVYGDAVKRYLTTDGKHTDDFGGVFVDGDGIYNICVVGKTPKNSEYLIYKRVKNSLNFLESICEGLSGKMIEYSIWRVSICENCNRVLICLQNESDIALVVEHLKAKNLYKRDSLNFYVGKPEIVID